jgi:site-specific recombinase XerD
MGINKQIKIYAAKSGIRGKRISSHTFRKKFGREVWRRNNYSEASLVKLSQLFRHSSTAITRIYLSITKEEVENLYDIQDLFVY